MTLNLNFDGDFDVFDGTQIVAWQAEAEGPQLVLTGLKRAVGTREIEASGGLFQVGDVRWHFALATGEEPPAVGALLIESGGTAWQVLYVERSVLGSRGTCVARKV